MSRKQHGPSVRPANVTQRSPGIGPISFVGHVSGRMLRAHRIRWTGYCVATNTLLAFKCVSSQASIFCMATTTGCQAVRQTVHMPQSLANTWALYAMGLGGYAAPNRKHTAALPHTGGGPGCCCNTRVGVRSTCARASRSVAKSTAISLLPIIRPATGKRLQV